MATRTIWVCDRCGTETEGFQREWLIVSVNAPGDLGANRVSHICPACVDVRVSELLGGQS